jgi:hypothetical protein
LSQVPITLSPAIMRTFKLAFSVMRSSLSVSR